MVLDGMEITKDNLTASVTQQSRVGIYFEQLKGEIFSVLANESLYRETIQKLETDLSVYKRAYNEVEAERRQLENLKQEAEKQKEHLENQLQGHRIVTLLDGDGAIFSNDLIAQGQAGGHTAAQKLSDSIVQHLSTNYGSNQYQLWVYVFFNKRGLMDTFGRVGLASLKQKFEDFVMGFNQAAERFLMVDVGTAKEAADAKIKAHLEDDIRLPQTYKIIFGGCHDNGYVTNLRSQITAGFKQKLILLRSYTEMAVGIAELELPIMTIPDLFMTQKLVMPSAISSTIGPPPGLAWRAPPSQPLGPTHVPSTPPSVPAIPPGIGQYVDAKSTVDSEPSVPKPLAPTYSSALQVPPKRVSTPELDPSGSSASSDDSDGPSFNPRASPTFSRSRHINPNIPLSKHKPPPCTLFYLANCKHGAECKYGHDYLLEAEHFAEIRLNAKKAPCPSVNKGDICLWGEECCYGHVCPLSTKCHFFKQGRCKFSGVDMHKEAKDQTVEMI